MIIRKLRLEKGLSQEQLSEMAGISPRTLQRIERGANASPETLKCLAAVLEVEFLILHKEQTMPTTPTTPNIPANPAPVAEEAPASPEPTFESKPEPTSNGFPELSHEEREAMEYVRDIKSFYTHAIQYGVVMVGLLIINLITSPGYLWVIWPALGWGIGVAAHGLSVFEVVNIFGDNWEKRQIEKRLRR